MEEEEKSGAELAVEVGDEEAGASGDRLVEVGGRNSDFVEEEEDDGAEVGVDVGGEELRVHIENSAEGRAGETEREEVGFE